MFGWGTKKIQESKTDNTEKYELQNGKELSERYMSPVDFVKRAILPIFKSNTPANMVNHDAFRQEKNYDASTNLAQKILNAYVNKLHGFVDYYKETPHNRMLMWGALFAALNEVLIADALMYKYETEIKEIDATEFEKLPKRYRGAFKKCQYNPNRYIYEQKNYTRVIRVIHNTKHPNYKLLNAYVEEIQTLIPKVCEKVIINEFLISSGCFCDTENKVYSEYYARQYGVPATKSRGYSYRVFESRGYSYRISDEKMETMARLQELFTKIASMCIVVNTKYGQQEIFDELNAENTQKNILVKAQNLTKTAENVIDAVHKTDELYTRDDARAATRRYSDFKKDVLVKLHKKIKVRR